MRTLLSILLLCSVGFVIGQPDGQAWRAGLDAYWAEIDSAYRDTVHSPIPKAERHGFTALERFPADPIYQIKARYEPNEGPVFGMKTSTDREPKYRAVGKLHFTIAGVEEELTVFQNIDLSRLDEYRNYLFVPFTDQTNAETTYGGGRYIDLEGPLGEEVILDFNRAYNPYCAYGGAYSCPIPPMENHLALPVRAGVLKFDH